MPSHISSSPPNCLLGQIRGHDFFIFFTSTNPNVLFKPDQNFQLDITAKSINNTVSSIDNCLHRFDKMNPKTTHVPSHMVIYSRNSQHNGPFFEASRPPIHTHPLHRFIQGLFDVKSGPNSTFAGEEAIAHRHHINQQYAGQCMSSPPNSEHQ
ncbi:hypothetical protein O181_020351 [Austropuccinia psidii MF-1]|uniref:Uncharacterized protein n=1 Tax=Austropuccinia psidii MF-1 TaxID=1389203 RepID=A0A9Q3CDA5_9BASI|nr:hypothetical protein [Austropuccinia psidii MF-1]